MKQKKWDFILILILVIIAIVSGLFVNLLYNPEGDIVQVLLEDKVVNEYSLNINGTYEIKTGDDINLLVIKDNETWIEEANCKDKICVKQGKISKGGESIICLPHRLVIRIASDDEALLDAISD